MAFIMQLQLSAAVTLLMLFNCVLASPEPLICEGIKCPPMNELTCPEDSQLREYIDFTSEEITTNKSEIVESLLNECCLARKCACKLCHIPSCRNDGMVIHETIAETQIPGKCCGSYECRPQPNCTVLRDTENYWLTDCQRCKCVYGQPICHRTCDEIMPNPTTAYCKSKNLNQFFSNGETWKDGCYECECTNGEEKCVLPFCKALTCRNAKTASLKDHCCPVCWPDSEDQDNFEGESSESHNNEVDSPLLAPLAPPIIVPRPAPKDTKPTTTSSTTTTTTTQSPPSPPPCMVNEDSSATYAVYPEFVEVLHNDHYVFYIIIVILSVLLVFMCIIVWHMHSQKHSYNPVSNFDNNFNNCQKTTLKIEKIGEII